MPFSKVPSRRSVVLILSAGLLFLIFVAALLLRGSPSPATPVQSASDIATQNEIAAIEATLPPAAYTDTIPTSEIVSTFSSNLGVTINQQDPSRGVTFSDVSNAVDFWSAPYLTILIYPDATSLKADDSNFQKDYTGINGDRSWESCLNVIAVFPNRLQVKVDNAINTWCTGSSPSPSATPTSTTPSTWYPRGYSEVKSGFAFKALPTNSYACDAGTICLEVYAESKTTCSDSIYAEINFLDSSGNIVDYGNSMTGTVPAKTPTLLTFTTANDSASTYEVTKVECNP